MTLLEKAWQHREEEVYPALFGDLGPGIYPLTAELFLTTFRQETYDPRWIHYGVFASPPNAQRSSWLYVSSGMSNPWEADAPADYSGFGVEFVLETDAQAEWPIIILQRMVAYNILLSHGRMGDYPPLDYGHRIPLRGSVALDRPSALENLVIARPRHYPAFFQLPSGRVDLLHFVGVTDDEVAFAKRTSSAALVTRLEEAEIYPMTLPDRTTIANL